MLCPVAEPGLGPGRMVHARQRAQDAVPRKVAQGEQNLCRRQLGKLFFQVRHALASLPGCGPVGGRRASYHRGYIGVLEAQSIVTANGGGLVGEAGGVQCAIQPLSRTVAGKHPSGTIRPVGGRSKPDDDEACTRVTEPGYGASPVNLVAKGASFRSGDLLAPRDKSCTAPASRNTPLHVAQGSRPL